MTLSADIDGQMSAVTRVFCILLATASGIAILGCGSSARRLTLTEWYKADIYCGHLKAEAFLRTGDLTAAERAQLRQLLNQSPAPRPTGPVNCASYKFTITVTAGPTRTVNGRNGVILTTGGSGAGIEGDNGPPCSIPDPYAIRRACGHR